MTLRELNQLRNLRREIRLLEQSIVRHDEVINPGIVLWNNFREIPPEEVTRRIEAAKHLMEEKLDQYIAEAKRLEAYINAVDDSLIRTAMRLRFLDGLSWTAVALRIGGNNTEDSVKKSVYRYIRRTSGGSCPDA